MSNVKMAGEFTHVYTRSQKHLVVLSQAHVRIPVWVLLLEPERPELKYVRVWISVCSIARETTRRTRVNVCACAITIARVRCLRTGLFRSKEYAPLVFRSYIAKAEPVRSGRLERCGQKEDDGRGNSGDCDRRKTQKKQIVRLKNRITHYLELRRSRSQMLQHDPGRGLLFYFIFFTLHMEIP